MAVLLLFPALFLAAVAVLVMLYEDRRLSGRSAPRPHAEPGPIREPGPVRAAVSDHAHEVLGWLEQRVERHRARRLAAAAAQRAESPLERRQRWSARWAAIDAKARALVERYTPLRRPSLPWQRRTEAAPRRAATPHEVDELQRERRVA